MKRIKLVLLPITIAVFFTGCGSTAPIISTPISNIDKTPIKVSELTENEKHTWGHLDLEKDTIPGMSVNKAYTEIIKGKKGTTTIVAVIDSGIDIDHEDLDDVIWVNKKEIPGNKKDDDNNGYIDDVHGWNFLGDGYNEQLEITRILASGNTNDPNYAKAKVAYDEQIQSLTPQKNQLSQILPVLIASDKAIADHLDKKEYTKDEVNAIKTTDQTLLQHKSIISQTYGFGLGTVQETIKQLTTGLNQIKDRLDYNLNKDLKGRKTGDNPNDFSQKFYGNGNVKPSTKEESHGSHVAGIIASERDNGKGVNGVANNVKIMSIRVVPNGDEYDKDVALGIRYAADNGAKIINMSFGKDFSPHSDWVKEAYIYAESKDVLIVHAAGNDSKDIDVEDNFPNDVINGKEVSNNVITVGALDPKYGSNIVAGFSNYGKANVDVFAPGGEIYSTFPENTYETIGGTSMAAPATAGVAALIRSFYPELSARQVKQIILDSGLPITTKVIVGGDANDVRPFQTLSKSGKIVNAYNALILASQIAKKQI
ncbi:peptidase S8 [Flavobacteriaceae bacterium AU392]|nr:peptidase S8 [Flavobacteriaceae bacterium]RKM84806.1 peptidase S8 [Flavobacteriaceae bacterium AU392]